MEKLPEPEPEPRRGKAAIKARLSATGTVSAEMRTALLLVLVSACYAQKPQFRLLPARSRRPIAAPLAPAYNDGPPPPPPPPAARPLPPAVVEEPADDFGLDDLEERRPAPTPFFKATPLPATFRPAPAVTAAPEPPRSSFRTPAPTVFIDDPPRPQYRQQGRTSVEPQQRQNIAPVAQPAARPYRPPKERKPVAQIISRYREDNPDGSITWGFENDDGTFKEETIGVDCVVKGKYGYIDPDGVRREYSYTSGNPCDKDNPSRENSEGFIDYQTNKYVLPNGDSVDLGLASKPKARRPVQSFRN